MAGDKGAEASRIPSESELKGKIRQYLKDNPKDNDTEIKKTPYKNLLGPKLEQLRRQNLLARTLGNLRNRLRGTAPSTSSEAGEEKQAEQ